MPRPLILGCVGTELGRDERSFFADANPLGFILFARNCESPDQVRALIAALRESVGRADAPVLIDQEGGRAARLGPPHWRSAPAARRFGDLYARDREAGLHACRLNARLIGTDLHDLGITVDCAPVLDLPAEGAHPVIGDRAFGGDPEAAAALGAAFCEGLVAAGVLPVLKHIPGHGRARVDSHAALPRVEVPRAEIEARDLVPFRALAARGDAPEPWAMTAHVVYAGIDPDRPATLSAAVIDGLVRKAAGFAGILVTDDLSMGALSGPYGERARGALEAGCDLVLHCNGDRAEMEAVAAAATPLVPETEDRLARSLGAVPAPGPFDRAEARAELAALLGTSAESNR